MYAKPLGLALLLSVLTTLTACATTRLVSEADTDQTTLAATQQGLFQGIIEDDLISFRGMPYAQAPVGDLRWRAPQPVPAHHGIKEADNYGSRCLQQPNSRIMPKNEAYTQPQSEDCLYLNVYRPRDANAPLPVMVWIHGGGLANGSGARPVNHGGKLAKHGVLIVTFNYRLGRLGFFGHPLLSAANVDSGKLFNYGLMDQIAALEWVQANIAAFGGDPNNVTIAGESAGGYSVSRLASSPLAQPLFHRMIVQSGYGRSRALRVAALAETTDKPVEAIGKALVAKLNQPITSAASLRAIPASDIINATDYQQNILMAVDGVTVVDDLFAAITDKNHPAKPLLIGTTDYEFGAIPKAVQYQLIQRYTDENNLESFRAIYGTSELRDTHLYSDFIFTAQAHGLATAYHEHSVPTYVYRFSVAGTASPAPYQLQNETIVGAFHASDLPYTFGNFTGDHNELTPASAAQRALSHTMMQYWVNFIRDGNPNANDKSLPQWQPYDDQQLMRFTLDGAAMQQDPRTAILDSVNNHFGL